MVQNALDEHGAMLKILPHLSKTTDDIVREVLAFLAVMLFSGNQSVQVCLFKICRVCVCVCMCDTYNK